MNNPAKMLKQVQEMQARMARVQADLEAATVEASAGGGAVKVVANGVQRLASITIDPDAAEDLEMLQDLVLAAVNEALDSSRHMAEARMREVTAGLGLPPGIL
jgi:DNA-binding YbaB/EbfC family protein